MKKTLATLALTAALVGVGLVSAPAAHAIRVDCQGDGWSWWGEVPSSMEAARMGLRCESQGGQHEYSFSLWEMIFGVE